MNLTLHSFIMNNYWHKRIFDKPRQIIDQFLSERNKRLESLSIVVNQHLSVS